jgi:two-component system chemotaxis response regulator CheB
MSGSLVKSGGRVRVLVAEYSAALRGRILEALAADPGIEVVGEATDGRTAIDLCLRLRPDVITMDTLLPVVTGLAATEYLMRHCPRPILVICPATDPGTISSTLDALAAGAVDVLEKPRTGVPRQDWERALVTTVRTVARIPVVTKLLSAQPGDPAGAPAVHPTPATPATPASSQTRPTVPGPRGRREVPEFGAVGLGASTGGPAAVAGVLAALPRPFPLPVLLVLHVGETFGQPLADWLQRVADRPVRLARNGEPIAETAGAVVMAPPGTHLVLRAGSLLLTRDPERHSCRPSVDVLFESLATELGPRVGAGLLTGMGRDGAAGLLEVHRRGGLTIAQDRATSVVFGMPGEAVRLGAAQQVLPIERIGPALGRLAVSCEGVRA